MTNRKLRKRIAWEAARLMYERSVTEYYTAKRQAARRHGIDPKHQVKNLPSNREIRDCVQQLATFYEGEDRVANLREMRLAALKLMWKLERFNPRLIGSVATGHVRQGSDIDVHLFSDNVADVTSLLDEEHIPYIVERKRIIKHHEERVFTHVHFEVRSSRDVPLSFELTIYAREWVNYPFKSSITGRTIERLDVPRMERLIRENYEDVDLDELREGEETWADPFTVFALLLQRLEEVKQHPIHHPEGDALYHSLQAFQLAREEFPYDEEMMSAALLHDVGKGIDPSDHVRAGLEALEGLITPRTRFLIEHHMTALEFKNGTPPAKLRAKLQGEWFEDLMTLRDLDDAARRRGVEVPTIEAALNYIRSLSRWDE